MGCTAGLIFCALEPVLAPEPFRGLKGVTLRPTKGLRGDREGGRLRRADGAIFLDLPDTIKRDRLSGRPVRVNRK